MYIEEKIDGQTEYQDLMQDWALSCASFISNVLFYYKQISSPSATVTSTIKKLENGPRKNILYKESLKTINDIPRWAILIRANKKKGERQEFFVADYHLWFYLGNNKAISNVVTDKEHKIKSIAIHDAIRTAPKFDHYDKIEIVSYFIPKE
jgi:ribosomal protein L30E